MRRTFPFISLFSLDNIHNVIQGEEDIEEETGIIRVQLGYVMQGLGREKEAATIYNQVEDSLELCELVSWQKIMLTDTYSYRC